MKSVKIKTLRASDRSVVLLLAFLTILLGFQESAAQTSSLPAQQRKEEAAGSGLIYLTREKILAGARDEGKLVVAPGFASGTTPALLKAFAKKYPFIQSTPLNVAGTAAAQRQLFDMASGSSNVDVFSPSSVLWSDYFKRNVIKKFDLRKMAKTGQLRIPVEMIDESGMIAWLGTNTGIIAYNSKLVPAEMAPHGWQSCVDPQWRGKVGVDTKPNVLVWLVPRWGEEKVLDFARKLKANDAVWTSQSTPNLVKLAAGEFHLLCWVYLHSTQRLLNKDPTVPIKMVVPDPVPVSMHEPEGVYLGARNPHAALLWMEFLAGREAQETVDSIDPGRASFLVEGTLSSRLVRGATVSLCGAGCRDQEDRRMEQIAVGAWGFPKAGYTPK
jgi:iron(III) transport system substrate-binding protein